MYDKFNAPLPFILFFYENESHCEIAFMSICLELIAAVNLCQIVLFVLLLNVPLCIILITLVLLEPYMHINIDYVFDHVLDQ